MTAGRGFFLDFSLMRTWNKSSVKPGTRQGHKNTYFAVASFCAFCSVTAAITCFGNMNRPMKVAGEDSPPWPRARLEVEICHLYYYYYNYYFHYYYYYYFYSETHPLTTGASLEVEICHQIFYLCVTRITTWQSWKIFPVSHTKLVKMKLYILNICLPQLHITAHMLIATYTQLWNVFHWIFSTPHIKASVCHWRWAFSVLPAKKKLNRSLLP